MKKRVYLDAAAAHPVRPATRRAFLKALAAYGNPSAPHEEGRQAARILEDARDRIARLTGAKSDAVIFTSGATESNALAIVGHIRARLASGVPAGELEVIYSKTQHASVIGAVEEVVRLGVKATPMPLTENGIAMDALRHLITSKTALITCDVVCSETGTRHDTRAIRRMIDEVKGDRPVFHVDATQAPLTENMDRTRLGADLIAFDAQKIGGVRGIGALIAPRAVALLPLTPGGGQERALRSGTPSPSLAAAFALSLEHANAERESFVKRAAPLKREVCEAIRAAFPEVYVNGGEVSAPNILNISFPGRDTDYLVALLDEVGYAVSTRSSCETDADGSRVVLAYTNDAVRAASTMRISFHANTRTRDIRSFIPALITAVTFIDGSR